MGDFGLLLLVKAILGCLQLARSQSLGCGRNPPGLAYGSKVRPEVQKKVQAGQRRSFGEGKFRLVSRQILEIQVVP